MTDEEAKTLGATHFRINGFGWKRYYAFKHGGWWLLCIDDEWYPDYEINPKDKLELIDEAGMNIEEIRKNAPDGANTYMLWFDSVVYFKSKRGVITHQWIKGYWNSCVNPSFKESYAYQCVSDYGYHNGEIKPLN